MNTQSTQSMIEAVTANDLDQARELLKAKPALANARHDFTTERGAFYKMPLHYAAEKNLKAMAELLIAAGAELEAETSWGATPLKWAANCAGYDVAETLLAPGADGMSLWVAAGLGKLESVKSFLEAAEPPDAARIDDAFYIACRNGHTDIARLLRAHGAQVDARGFFGATGLHWAAINGHIATVEFLLQQAANLELRDEEFDATPLGWARTGGHQDIVDFLLQQGAK
jgi:uncharacterized protein